MKCKDALLLEFIRGELNGDQTRHLLDHLEDCLDCRERLQAMAWVQANFRRLRDARKRKFRLWLIAASLLLSLAWPFLDYIRHDPAVPEPLSVLATQEKYPHFPLNTRSADQTDEMIRKRAFTAYRASRYQEALQWFERARVSEEVVFYRGVCHYLLGEDQKALRLFSKTLERQGAWKIPALWYCANTYLKLRQSEKAMAVFKELLDEGSTEYEARVIQLLARLQQRETGK